MRKTDIFFAAAALVGLGEPVSTDRLARALASLAPERAPQIAQRAKSLPPVISACHPCVFRPWLAFRSVPGATGRQRIRRAYAAS